MKIFILRHGKAEPIMPGHTDKHRCLSPKGHKQLGLIGQWMLNHEYLPKLIISSPYKRCRETAEIIQGQLNIDSPIQYEDCLIYGSEPMLAFSMICSLEVDSVLLSSHMPLVGELVHLLAPGTMLTSFKTAEIVKIRFDKQSQHGIVTANITPNEI